VTLRFHRELYDGAAVDAAVKQYDGYAEFELTEDPDYWVVAIALDDDAARRELAGELANYALGLTIERRSE